MCTCTTARAQGEGSRIVEAGATGNGGRKWREEGKGGKMEGTWREGACGQMGRYVQRNGNQLTPCAPARLLCSLGTEGRHLAEPQLRIGAMEDEGARSVSMERPSSSDSSLTVLRSLSSHSRNSFSCVGRVSRFCHCRCAWPLKLRAGSGAGMLGVRSWSHSRRQRERLFSL